MNELYRPAIGAKRNRPGLPAGFALLTYTFGVGLALAIRFSFEGDVWLVLLHIAAAASLYFLWSRGQWGEARFESFGAVVLLAALLYRLIGIVDVLTYGSRIEDWPASVYSSEPWWAITRGEVLTHLSLVLVVLSWHWLIGRNSVRTAFLVASKRRGKTHQSAWFFYFFAMALELSNRLFNLEYGSAAQMIHVFYLSGIAATLVIANARPNNKSRILWAAGLALPLSFMALGSNMKENIIIPLLPTGILLWVTSKKIGAKLVLLIAAILFTAFLQAYVSFARPILWSETETRISVEQTIDQFLLETSGEDLLRGLEGAIARLNLTNAHAWSVAIVDRMGYDPDSVFGLARDILIPRFLWPDKPLVDPGGIQTERLMGVSFHESTRTSIAMGFGGVLYIGGGWIAVVLGSVVFGLFVATCQVLLTKFATETALVIFNFVLFISALRWDEKTLVPAIAGMIVVVFGLTISARTLEWLVPTSPVSSPRSLENLAGSRLER